MPRLRGLRKAAALGRGSGDNVGVDAGGSLNDLGLQACMVGRASLAVVAGVDAVDGLVNGGGTDRRLEEPIQTERRCFHLRLATSAWRRLAQPWYSGRERQRIRQLIGMRPCQSAHGSSESITASLCLSMIKPRWSRIQAMKDWEGASPAASKFAAPGALRALWASRPVNSDSLKFPRPDNSEDWASLETP